MRRKIASLEWLWVVIASLIVMAVVSAPYWIGLRASSPEMTFGGFLFGVEDMHSYIAKMRYGAGDGWLFRLIYTTEPHEGKFVFTFHMALGKLAGLLVGQGWRINTTFLVIVYHAARIIFGLLLLAVIYHFVAEYLELPSQRRLAWGLAILAGGLGWIPTVAGLLQSVEVRLPVEFYVPESFSLLHLYGFPHLSLARSLMFLGWLLLFPSPINGKSISSRTILAGLIWLAMGLIVPFYVALLGVLIAAWLASLWLLRHTFPTKEFGRAIIAGVLPVAILIYNLWAFSADPVFAAWSAQNSLPSPPVVDYLLAYGLLLAVAIIGVREAIRKGLDERSTLLLIWPPVAAALIYLPIPVQRRLLEGVIVPISILAVMGIWKIVGDKPEENAPKLGWRLRQISMGSALSLLFPSVVMLIGGGVITASRPEWPLFHPADEQAALVWLRDHATPESVVLSTYESGNVLPAYAPVRVYVGHGPETVDSNTKRHRAAAFFHGPTSDRDRQALLAESGAQYIWVGPPERCGNDLCSGFDPTTLGLQVAFERGSYIIYEIAE